MKVQIQSTENGHGLNGMVRDFDETSMPDSMSHAIG